MSYAHPEALVGTDWLPTHPGDPQGAAGESLVKLPALPPPPPGHPQVRVVDSSFKLPGIPPTARHDYDQGHIRSAVFFDIDDICEPGTSLPHMIPSPDLFAQKVGALGIGDGDRVVVYDSVGLWSAGGARWVRRLLV